MAVSGSTYDDPVTFLFANDDANSSVVLSSALSAPTYGTLCVPILCNKREPGTGGELLLHFIDLARHILRELKSESNRLFCKHDVPCSAVGVGAS